MYEVQFDGRKVVKHADHIKERVTAVLQIKKPALISPAGNVATSSRTVPLDVSPHITQSPRLTETHNTPVTPRRAETRPTDVTPRHTESTTEPPRRTTTTETNVQTDVPRRSERLAQKPRRRWA